MQETSPPPEQETSPSGQETSPSGAVSPPAGQETSSLGAAAPPAGQGTSPPEAEVPPAGQEAWPIRLENPLSGLEAPPPELDAPPPRYETPQSERGPFQPRHGETVGYGPVETPLDASTAPFEAPTEERMAAQAAEFLQGGGDPGLSSDTAYLSPGTAYFDDDGLRHWGAPPTAHDAASQGERHGHRKTPDGSTRRRWMIPLVAAGLVTVTAVGLALVVDLSTGSHPAPKHRTGPEPSALQSTGTQLDTPQAGDSPSGPAAKGAAAQAAAVNVILQAGKAAHDRLSVSMATCDDLVSAAPAFQQVVQERQNELAQARQVPTDQLPGGADLKQAMIDAYSSSLDADKAYVAWAQETQAAGCGGGEPPQSANHDAAIAANDKAGPAKRRVVALWSPIAQSQGLPVYAWGEL
ncbi:hypothetical protein [Actinoallomurus sp. CA-150999]|uniref:hypothetical protein n=1 Tax=Actinoallomurus sp. CA-150999 TaxID=3239887 RepID=UPI003D906E60